MVNNMELTENNSKVSKELDSTKTKMVTLSADIAEVTSSKDDLGKTVDDLYIR